MPPAGPEEQIGGRWKALFSGHRMLRLHCGRVVVHQGLGDFADLESIRSDLRNRGNLGGRSGQEALFETFEFFRHYSPLDDLETALFGQIDDRAAGDAVEEAVRLGRM